MWKPNESLDEYIVTPLQPVIPDPPRPVTLRLTGEFEVLKPMTPPEVCVQPAPMKAYRPSPSTQPQWFRRFLAVGSGALVLIALALMSAILVGINDSVVERDVATNEAQDQGPSQPQELFTFDLSTPSAFAPLTPINIVRSNIRRKRSQPKVHLADNKPRRELRSLPQPEQPKFMPTTLVIYAENGVINTRIEPWLQVSNTMPPAFHN